MLKKKVWMLTVAGITALAAMLSPAAAETLRLAHHHAVGGAVDTAAKKFAELVKEKTKGEVTIRVFPAAQLGQEREAYDLVEQGALDISMTTTSFLDKVYPAVAVTTMPFVFKDWDHARAAYNGQFGETIRSSVRGASQTEILAYFGVGFRQFFFTNPSPVKELADVAGRKIRSPENYAYIRMMELLGVKPTPITFGEVYTAMQTGVAEGFEGPPGVVIDSKLHEVAKSVLKTNHMYSAMVFAMNKDKFGKLSAGNQEQVRNAAREAAAAVESDLVIPAEQAAYKKFESAGLTISEPGKAADWSGAVKPMVDDLAAKTPGARELLDQLAK